MIVVKRQDALHQVPHPRLPLRDPESSEAVTCALLAAHSTIHMAGPPRAAVVIKGPKLDRPKVNIGVTLEEWNIFKRRWDVFVSGSGLDPTPRHHNSSNAPATNWAIACSKRTHP